MIEEFLKEQNRPIWLELEYANETKPGSAHLNDARAEKTVTHGADEDLVLEFYPSPAPTIGGRAGISSPTRYCQTPR